MNMFRTLQFHFSGIKNIVTVAVVFLLLGSALPTNANVITGPFSPGSGYWTAVPNGGFESGLTGWETSNCNINLGTFSTDHSDPVALGVKSARSNPIPTNGTGPGFCIRCSTTFTLNSNTTYVLSGFFNTRELDGNKLYLGLVNNDLSYTAALTGSSELAYGENEWQFAWTEFQPRSSTETLYLRVIHDENFKNGKHGYFDEIALTELSSFEAPTVVPIPAALPLFGSGLLGIVWIRRKYRK